MVILVGSKWCVCTGVVWTRRCQCNTAGSERSQRCTRAAIRHNVRTFSTTAETSSLSMRHSPVGVNIIASYGSIIIAQSKAATLGYCNQSGSCINPMHEAKSQESKGCDDKGNETPRHQEGKSNGRRCRSRPPLIGCFPSPVVC